MEQNKNKRTKDFKYFLRAVKIINFYQITNKIITNSISKALT